MKRLIGFLLSVVLMLSASISAFAYVPTSEFYDRPISYTDKSGNNTIINYDRYCFSYASSMAIPGVHWWEVPRPKDVLVVGRYENMGYPRVDEVEELVIKSINRDCDEVVKFKDVTRDNDYTVIRFEAGAIDGCSKLKQLNLNYPNTCSVKNGETIEEAGRDKLLAFDLMTDAIKNCNNLESIFFGGMPLVGPVSVEFRYDYSEVYKNYITTNSISNCPNLKFVVIQDPETLVAENLFENCPKLTLFCKKDSQAQRWAINHKVPYINFTDELTEEEKADFNADLYAAVHPDIAEQLGGFENLMYAYCKSNNQNGYGGIDFDADKFDANAYAQRNKLTGKTEAEIIAYLAEHGGNSKPFLKGDSDDDGTLTSADAAVLLQHVLDASYKTTMQANNNNNYMDYIDVDKDGILTSYDAACILQKVVDDSFVMECEK